MARTTTMRLIELMVLREDIHSVLKYLGELGEFQFQQEFASDSSDSAKRLNPDASVFERLQQVRDIKFLFRFLLTQILKVRQKLLIQLKIFTKKNLLPLMKKKGQFPHIKRLWLLQI